MDVCRLTELSADMGKRLFITGGTGFFGKSLLDYRRRHPEWPWAKAKWVMLSRSPEKFIAENPILAQQPGGSFVEGDVRNFAFPKGRFNAIIHAATSAVTTLSDAEMTRVIQKPGIRLAEIFAVLGGPILIEVMLDHYEILGSKSASKRLSDGMLVVESLDNVALLFSAEDRTKNMIDSVDSEVGYKKRRCK